MAFRKGFKIRYGGGLSDVLGHLVAAAQLTLESKWLLRVRAQVEGTESIKY